MWLTASRQCVLSNSYFRTAVFVQKPINTQIGLGHQVRTPRVSSFWPFFVKHLVPFFNLSWLDSINRDKTRWLVSRPPPYHYYCADYSQLRKAPCFMKSGVQLSKCVARDCCSHLTYEYRVPTSPQVIKNKLSFCCLCFLRYFIFRYPYSIISWKQKNGRFYIQNK